MKPRSSRFRLKKPAPCSAGIPPGTSKRPSRKPCYGISSGTTRKTRTCSSSQHNKSDNTRNLRQRRAWLGLNESCPCANLRSKLRKERLVICEFHWHDDSMPLLAELVPVVGKAIL